MNSRARGGWVLVLLALGGCSETTKRKVKDTESRRFVAECTPDGKCKLSQTEGPKAENKPDLILRREGRVLSVCAVAGGETQPATVSDCRALVCKEDKHCPPAHGAKHGTCVSDLCIEPSAEISVDNSVILCLAGTGLGENGPKQVGLKAMAINCGTPCKVPAPCMQP